MLDKQQVQRQFDRSAGTYNNVAGMQRDIVDHLLASNDDVVLSGSVLDAGCGTGYGLKKIAERCSVQAVTGVDLAPNMIQMAAKACPSAGLIVGDIERLPFAAASQDGIFSSSAIQWCDADVVIREFNRCLVPGGALLMSTFVQGTLAEWRALWGRSNEQSFLRVRDVEWLLAYNWSNVRLERRAFVQTFTTFTDAVASIRDLGAGDASPQRARTPMTKSQLALVKRRVNRIIDQQGFIALKYQLAFVSAIKAR